MRKIPSLFMRNYDTDRLVRNEVVRGCEWVGEGHGYATIKLDGTSCLVRGGVLYKRLDLKKGRSQPAGFEPCQPPDPHTGHWPGWVPVDPDSPSNKWHTEAWAKIKDRVTERTMELLGPKVQGNPYGLTEHVLIAHDVNMAGADHQPPRTFDALREWFTERPIHEGLVWWWWREGHLALAKIKRRDFGLPWPTPEAREGGVKW